MKKMLGWFAEVHTKSPVSFKIRLLHSSLGFKVLRGKGKIFNVRAGKFNFLCVLNVWATVLDSCTAALYIWQEFSFQWLLRKLSRKMKALKHSWRILG